MQSSLIACIQVINEVKLGLRTGHNGEAGCPGGGLRGAGRRNVWVQ